MLILIRSNDANPDPRLQKYLNYLEEASIKYKVIAWNRDGNRLERENFLYFEKKASFGLGYKNIPNKILWFLYIIKQLIVYRKSYKFIHACDLDTAIPAYFMKTILNKKIIFDVFDWISSDKQNGLLSKFISKIENHIFLKSDYAILCEEYRIDQVKVNYRRPFLLLPNIPDIMFYKEDEVKKIIESQRTIYQNVVSYVGVFDDNRGIEDMLEYVSNNKQVVFNIAGFGKLEKCVLEYSDKNENIIYWGKVDYNKGLNIQKNADIIMALYYLKNPVHKYAAPNKFYESLFLGIPLFTNENTELANKVKHFDSGYVIKEGQEAINMLFNNLDKSELFSLGENAKNAWEEIYENYTKEFMAVEYKRVLTS